jgi:hypothetical protein
METVSEQRFQSGETCVESGRYEFAGFVTGPPIPPPPKHELQMVLRVGEVFPLIPSQVRPCYWALMNGVARLGLVGGADGWA